MLSNSQSKGDIAQSVEQSFVWSMCGGDKEQRLSSSGRSSMVRTGRFKNRENLGEALVE